MSMRSRYERSSRTIRLDWVSNRLQDMLGGVDGASTRPHSFTQDLESPVTVNELHLKTLGA